MYLVSSLRDWMKQKRNQAYLVLMVYLFAHTIINRGLSEALKYGVMLVGLCFLVSLYFRIYFYIIYDKGSRNCWIFNATFLCILSLAFGKVLSIEEIYLLLSITVCVFTVLLMLRLITETRE